jgi:ribose transport system substrate-binding protein
LLNSSLRPNRVHAKNAASITTSTLQSNPDLKGIFGASIFSVQGAGIGVPQTGKNDEVRVAAFDASPTQVENLQRGNVDVLIIQHPNNIGNKRAGWLWST